MQDQHVNEQEITAELLDRYPVIAATAGDRSYVALRPDRRPARVYHRDTAAEVENSLPTLWIVVADYENDTIEKLQGLVAESDARRRVARP